MTQTVIIGGGPAGMAAAIAAARRGEDTLLVERLDRVGKKLLATGNGRCNLMNRSAPAYPGGEAFARQVLARCGEKELESFFRSLGLRLRTEDMGRVYPASGQAASVLDALRMALTRKVSPCVPLALCNVWKSVVSASPFLCLTMFCTPHVLLWQEAERHSRSWAATAPAMRSLPDWGTPCGAPSPP